MSYPDQDKYNIEIDNRFIIKFYMLTFGGEYSKVLFQSIAVQFAVKIINKNRSYFNSIENIKTFIYEGEANAGSPDLYKCRFPAMIDDWREKFHEGSGGQTDANFPFGFVQVTRMLLISIYEQFNINFDKIFQDNR